MVSRAASIRHLRVYAVIVASVFAATSGGAATLSPNGGGRKDKAPPSIAISAPVGGAKLSASTTISGTASDNVALSKVEISIDGGGYRLATGTKAWSLGLDTATYGDGTHTIAAKATDTSGNISTATVTVSFSNAPSPPPPTADTTAPAVAISLPNAGSTVSGTVSVTGTASDNAAVVKVELSIDGSGYQPAQGTTSWSEALNTTTYSDGAHTLAARATDTSGNIASASETINVSNTPTTPPPPPGVAEQMVTPEGVTIQIYSGITGSWTCQKVYDLLKANALELTRIGPSLTIAVQTQYPTVTSVGVSQTGGGTFYNYNATMWINSGSASNFNAIPDEVVAHEYGVVWSQYHLYMSHGGDWNPYFSARGILGDARIDSSYAWDRHELIADDYRMLFGSAAAVSEMRYINPDLPDPGNVSGLKDWFLNVWAVP